MSTLGYVAIFGGGWLAISFVVGCAVGRAIAYGERQVDPLRDRERLPQ